jgi:excisionase family DNA binding protein
MRGTLLDPQKAITMDEKPLTMSVQEAGRKYYGLSRNGSYDAAHRGEIPTIRVGRLLRVPVRALERLLDEAGQPSTA